MFLSGWRVRPCRGLNKKQKQGDAGEILPKKVSKNNNKKIIIFFMATAQNDIEDEDLL